MKKKILMVSGARSEFGLQEKLLIYLKSNKCKPLLIVTGSHLSNLYGNTIKDIIKKKLK